MRVVATEDDRQRIFVNAYALDGPHASLLAHRQLPSAMAAGILIGGRAFDILVYELDYYAAHPLRAPNFWAGGMASHGLMLGGLVGVLLFCRLRGKPFLVTTDELSVPAAFLMGVGRIGNFIEGGVIGSVTAMPWGVIFSGVDGPRHPVALYDGAKNLILALVLILVLKRWPAGHGVASGAFLCLYGGLRFLVDSFRDYEGGWLGIGQGQYFNLAMAAIGLMLLIWALQREAPAVATPAPEPRRVNPVLAGVFVFLCLYTLGIPTSWTRANIEAIRAEEPAPGP